MSGRWVSTGGKGRMWVPEGEQLFSVTYQAFIAASSAEDAIGKAQELWGHPGTGWTATPRPLGPGPSVDGIRPHRPMSAEDARLAKMAAEATPPATRGQLPLPEAMIDRVHGRVQSGLAEPESPQVTPDEPAG